MLSVWNTRTGCNRESDFQELEDHWSRRTFKAFEQAEKKMAQIIRHDGSRTMIDTSGMTITERMELFQSSVDGYIEGVPANGTGYLLFNENGKALNLPRNEAATELVRDFIAADDYIAGVAIYASREELDHEAPVDRVRLSPAKTESVILVIERESEIETGNIAAAVANLNGLVADKESFLKYEGAMTFVVTGYDADPRELADIPEVRRWFDALSREWNLWSWFLSKQDDSVPRLFTILLAGERAGSNEIGELGWRIDVKEVSRRMISMYAEQNRLIEQFDIDEEINRRVSEEFAQVIANNLT